MKHPPKKIKPAAKKMGKPIKGKPAAGKRKPSELEARLADKEM
jgi:hypothetical protein